MTQAQRDTGAPAATFTATFTTVADEPLTRAPTTADPSPDPRLVVLYARLSKLAAIATSAIGAIVLAAWLLELPRVAALVEGGVTMKANTALAFVLAGAALLLVQLPAFATRPGRAAAATCAAAVGVIGALSLAQSLLGWDLGIDQLFAQDSGDAGTVYRGRMAMLTAANFMLVAAALLLVDVEVAGRWRPTQFLAFATLAVSFVPALGYAYSVDSLLGFPADTRMALPTVLAFVALSLGLVAARPDRGLMALCASRGPGGRMARWLLPVTILLPAVIGGLRLAGQQAGLYGTEFGIVMFVTAVTVGLTFVVCRYSVTLERSDRLRRRSELQMSELVEHAPDAMLMVDERGVMQMANAEAERLFGYARHELVGTAVELLVPDAVRAGHVAQREAFLREPSRRMLGAGRELSGRHKDGSPVPVEISVSRVDVGPGAWFMATVRDITERKRASAALRDSEQRARTTFEQAAIGFAIVSLDGRFEQVNEALCRIVGYPNAELRALTFQQITHPEDLETDLGLVRRLLAGEIQTYTLEKRYIRKDRSEVWINLTVSLVRDAAGAPAYFIAGIEDISRRKLAEAEIRSLNADLEGKVRQRTAQLETANKDLESFGYSISHDLRAPLRAIDTFSALLREDHAAQLDADGRHLLDVIRKGTGQMGQLIDDIFELSQSGSRALQREPVAMEPLAREVMEELQPANARHAAFEVSPLPPAFADRALIRQVLSNLLGNAVKYSGKRDDACITLRGRVEDGETLYEIGDNGVGFDPRYAGKLFGVFQRLHDRGDFAGSGVGLTIVKRIVTKHGGRVWADGRPGTGATFGFSLPRQGPGAAGA